jgi:hypothetical protein
VTAPDKRIHTSRHQDAIDAGLEAQGWLEALIERYPAIPAREIEYKAFERGDGTVTVFWHDNRPIGIAIALRDAMNFTHLTLVESPSPPRTDRDAEPDGDPEPQANPPA